MHVSPLTSYEDLLALLKFDQIRHHGRGLQSRHHEEARS